LRTADPFRVLRPPTRIIAIQVRLTGEPLGAERACTPGPVNPLVDLGAAEVGASVEAAEDVGVLRDKRPARWSGR
jgi:hypothetical protein